MKTSEAFRIWTNCVENKWEGNLVPLGERKLDCTLTKRATEFCGQYSTSIARKMSHVQK